MKRIACIDVGSNSVLLLVIETDVKGNWKVLIDESVITRLGEGSGSSLKESAIKRTVGCVCSFVEKAKKVGAGRIDVIGTMALRRAGNRDEFLNLVKKECGMVVRVLSEEEEAYYSFTGISFDTPGRLIVVDVGGGSTEVVAGKGEKISFIRSFPVGAVSMTERFLKSDPVKQEEFSGMLWFLEDMFKRVKPPEGEQIIGVGGTITTLGSIFLGCESFKRELVEGKVLERNEIIRIMDELKNMTVKERSALKGLEHKRADIILAGIGIVYTIIKWLDAESIVVSTRGVRYGVVFQNIIEKRRMK